MRRYVIPFAVLLLMNAGSARAETLLTAFGGAALGGATESTRGTYGASLGFLGGGVLGFEVEAATTPEFFGNATGDVFTNNNDGLPNGIHTTQAGTNVAFVTFVVAAVVMLRQRLKLGHKLADWWLLPYGIAAYPTAICLVFSGQSRFHFPAMPFIAMTCGWLIADWWVRHRTRVEAGATLH